MTSAPAVRAPDPAGSVDDRHPDVRLQLKPMTSGGTGHVDGGWWPHSRDLESELGDLLAELAGRLGRVERVGYHLGDWSPTARKIVIGGGVVRLAGYRSLPAGTLDVLSAQRSLTLLVVPPDAPPRTAHDVLAAAGGRGNTDDVASLLRLLQ